MRKFRTLVKDHMPVNKRSYEVESGVCEVVVVDCDGTGTNKKAWVEIQLSETYMLKDGKRDVNRTISVVLNQRQRAELIAALMGE